MSLIEGEIGMLQVERKIRNRVKRQMEKTQREYYLNEQMKAIQRELGDGDEGREDIAELENRIKNTKLSKEARTKADAEMKKLRQMSPMSAESTVVRNYLDWLLSLPWGNKKKVKKDIDAAQAVLDEDHYGLDKVKDRILEYLAVQARTNKLRGPILCLVGPPGVGKTSLGKSIAQGDGPRLRAHVARRRARRSGNPRSPPHLHRLDAGPRDPVDEEGEERATRSSCWTKSTSSAPIIAAIRRRRCSKCWTRSKTPRSTTTISKWITISRDVLFITTANSLNMPQPLLDRMEIIRIPGYTEDEKLEIAKRHLLPKQYENNGLKKDEFSVSEDALRDLIRRYTREAGVRSLEREIGNLARKAVRELEQKKTDKVEITAENLPDYAGVWKYRFGETDLEDRVGVITGLAWTEVGGDLLTIEAVSMPGKGAMTVTGNLKDVMKESISAAVVLRPLALDAVRREAARVPHARHPRARAGRRDAEGRPVGRRRDGDGDRLGADAATRSARISP